MEDSIKELEELLQDIQYGSANRNYVEQTLENVIAQLKEIE